MTVKLRTRRAKKEKITQQRLRTRSCIIPAGDGTRQRDRERKRERGYQNQTSIVGQTYSNFENHGTKIQIKCGAVYVCLLVFTFPRFDPTEYILINYFNEWKKNERLLNFEQSNGNNGNW